MRKSELTHTVMAAWQDGRLYITNGLYLFPHEAHDCYPGWFRLVTREEVLANLEIAELKAGQWAHITLKAS